MNNGKHLLTFFVLCLSLGTSGCSLIQDTRNAGDGAAQTVKEITRSTAMSDLTQTTAALQEYYVLEGKYPADLAQLKLELYHPEDLDYDPQTGKLRSKTFPDL